jgi:hypothetical protein
MIVEQIVKGTAGQASVYLVKIGPGGDEKIIGMLEKYPNTRTEKHPWKAFKGWGASREFLGAFYEEKDLAGMSVGDTKDCKVGGQSAAIKAIEIATGWYGG